MKYCLPIMLLAAVSCAANHEDRYLGQRDFSLTQQVTCLSEGRERLWIGTGTGSIASFDPVRCRYSEPIAVDCGQVYCIREFSGDTLLVGVRDAGLKLVKADEASGDAEVLTQFVLSGPKRMNYSPYSFLIKRQEDHYARQCGFRCDTLFCGTSNGLYWLPLKENAALGDTVILKPICGENADEAQMRFNSLAEKDGDVYAGGPPGLLRVRNPEAEDEAERYVAVSGLEISHVSVRGDVLQILDGEGRLYRTEAMHIDKKRFELKPLLFFSDGKTDFALSEYEVEMRDAEGNRRTFSLNGKVAICAGLSDRGRECFVKKGDFYHVATSSGICRIPVSINLGSDVIVTSACAGRSPDEFFALSEDGNLYRIRTSDAKARFMRNIVPHKGEMVRGLAGCIGDRIYFCTDKDVYYTGSGLFSGIHRAGLPRREPTIISAIATRDIGIAVSYADETFIMRPHDGMRPKNGAVDTLRLGGDSYVCAMELVMDRTGNATGIMLGTLNRGLYRAGLDGSVEKIEDIGSELGGIKDIVCIGDETAVLTSDKVVRIKSRDNGWAVTGETAVPHETSGLFSCGGRLHAVKSTGGTFAVNDGAEILNNSDLRFLSSELDLGRNAADYGRELRLISENGCIFNPEDGSVTPAGLRSPGAFERLAKNKGGLWLMLSLAGIAAVVLGAARLTRILRVRTKQWRTALGIIARRNREILRIREEVRRRELLRRFEALTDEFRAMDRKGTLEHLPEDCRKIAENGDAEELGRAIEALEQGREAACKALRAAEEAEEALEVVRQASVCRLNTTMLTGGAKPEVSQSAGGELPHIVIESAERLRAARESLSEAGVKEIGSAAAGFCAEYDSFNTGEALRSEIADFTETVLENAGISTGRHFITLILERLRATEATGTMLKKSLSLMARTNCLGIILETDDLMEEFANALDGPGVMEAAKLKEGKDDVAEEQRLAFYCRFNELAEEVYNALGEDEQAELKTARIYGSFNSKDDYSETWMMILTGVSGRMDMKRARWLCKRFPIQTNFDTAKSRLRKKLADYRMAADSEENAGANDDGQQKGETALIVPLLLKISTERLGQSRRPQ